jgi:hypothetical protein
MFPGHFRACPRDHKLRPCNDDSSKHVANSCAQASICYIFRGLQPRSRSSRSPAEPWQHKSQLSQFVSMQSISYVEGFATHYSTLSPPTLYLTGPARAEGRVLPQGIHKSGGEAGFVEVHAWHVLPLIEDCRVCRGQKNGLALLNAAA